MKLTEEEDYKEELLNSITHGLGLLLCVVAIPVLMTCAAAKGGVLNIGSVAVYAITLILVYASSTVYHSVTHRGIKEWMQLIDHLCIYLLIAGSYTPFLVIFIQNSWFWVAVLWTLALVGMILKCITGCNKYVWFSIAFYIAMGWVGLLNVSEIYTTLPITTTYLLIAAGVIYSLGVIFFVWDNLKYNHAIWHLFVMAGSATHFASLMYALNYG